MPDWLIAGGEWVSGRVASAAPFSWLRGGCLAI